MKSNARIFAAVLLALSAGLLFAVEDEWNLPAAQRVSEAEAAAARGELGVAQRVLTRLESEAEAASSLTERAAASAHADRVRLALGRAHTRAGSWEQALPLLDAIALEGKSTAVQRAICAARLDALKPLLFQADGRIVAPWTPVANDRHGPLQPAAALRAPYTRVNRRDAAVRIDAALTAWQRIAGKEGGALTESERATVAALDESTAVLVRYAWGLANFDAVTRVLDSLPNPQQNGAGAPIHLAAERRSASLRFARLLLDERDLRHAVLRLLELERAEPKDDLSADAAEELLRIQFAFERLSATLPMCDPGAAAAVQPYLKDPAWAARREKIVRELDTAIGTVDLSIVLGASSLEPPTVKYDAIPVDSDGKATSEIEVPPDILAKAELGDHFETINMDRPDRYRGAAMDAPGKKRSRYSQLGLLAGVLHKNLLQTINPHRAGAREVREEYELQVDHQEFLIEPLSARDESSGRVGDPSYSSPEKNGTERELRSTNSVGCRPTSPAAPLRLTVLSRYHGTLELEARRLPGRESYEKLDSSVTPRLIDALPIAKTYSVELSALADNLDADPSKHTIEITDHGLARGFYVLTARARYSPVVAVSRLAVSDARLIARHAPREVLLWTVDRLTSAPRPGAKLSGEITLHYSADTAWGDAPLPARIRTQSPIVEPVTFVVPPLGGTARNPSPGPPKGGTTSGDTWERIEFLKGFGDAINENAQLAGSDSYMAGVAEGKKRRAEFPPQTLKLPLETDASGRARIALPPSWRGHNCRIRALVDGCEVDALDLSCSVKQEHAERVIEWVADRPAVRPGQSVRLRGFVRESRDGRLSPVHGGEAPLTLSVGGTMLFDATVQIDDAGVCVFEQLIDPDTQDGTLVATSERKSKPLCAVTGGALASRRVRLELPEHPSTAGARVKGKVFVESAAGVALAGVPVTIRTTFSKYEWDQNLPLPFGDNFARGANAGGSRMQGWDAEQELISNQAGEAEFDVELPEGTNSVGWVHAVAAGGLRSNVEQYGVVLGLVSSCVWRVEKFEQPTQGKPAHLTIEARMLSGEAYTRPFEAADEQGHILATFTPGADGRGHADVQPLESRTFRLRPVNTADGGWLPLASTQPHAETPEHRGRVLGVQLNKNEYRVGETAILTLRADRPNLSVLFTTENSGITRSEVLTISARSKQLEIKLGDQDAPNTTIALTVLADDLVDCVLVPLNVAQTERELAVKISADKSSAEPGQTVQLTTVVLDSHGKAVADAEVVLAVYDRQLLTLAGDPAPRFGEAFWAASRVPHDVEWGTGYHTFTYGAGFLWLAPEWSFGPYAVSARGLYNEAGSGHGSFGNRNGGGRRLMVKRHGGSRATESLRVRSRFSEQALWLTHLKTGADGTVSAPLIAPDALTTYRVVAYALDARGDAGSATLDLPVRRDVELALELPPELREGDLTEVALGVYNHSSQIQSVKLKTVFPLPVLSAHLNGAAALPETLELAPHSNATVRYLLDGTAQANGGMAPNAGDGAQALRFEVSASAPDGAALDRAVFQAPLRMAGRPEREVIQAVLRQNASLHVPFAGSFDAHRTSLTVTLRRGLKGLALDVRNLQYIFPEHCLEQTLSRFVPSVVLADALKDEDATPDERARLEGVLHSGVVRLRTLGGGSELQPLIAWYARRLAALPAGRAALRTDRDWQTAAAQCERELLSGGGKDAKLEDFALEGIADRNVRATAARTPVMFGAFRRELWLAFGAAQQIPLNASAAERRSARQRFAKVGQSAVQLARARKLDPHDRALAGLLCAQADLRAEAEELLALNRSDADAAAEPKERSEAWTRNQARLLACALDVMTAIALEKSETDILPLALRLEGLVSARAEGFGTTFLNGVGLLALADALKACGGNVRTQAGPIVLKLSGKTVAELPQGASLRRVTLDAAAVEAAFRDEQNGKALSAGWDLKVAAPDGQSVGLAVERCTLIPERVEVLSREALEKRVAGVAHEAESAGGTPAPQGVEIHRALFVRAPESSDRGRAMNVGWRPYAGQPVPRGTELLVLTSVLRAPGVQCVQIELPTLAGWEAAQWNEQPLTDARGFGTGDDIEFQQREPGFISGSALTAALKRDDGIGRGFAAELLRMVKAHEWADVGGRLVIAKNLVPARFADRGGCVVLSPFTSFNGADAANAGAEQNGARIVFAQSAPLRSAGRYQLPGARAWAWYDPAIDVTGAADRVEISADKGGSINPPDSALPTQAWLERTWAALAETDFKMIASERADESVSAVNLALQALGQCKSEAAPALIDEWLKVLPRPKGFAAMREQREFRLAIIRETGLDRARPEIARALLAPFASFDGLRRDCIAADFGGTQDQRALETHAGRVGDPSYSLETILDWAKTEKDNAKALLTVLAPAERVQAVALQKATAREFVELLFGGRADATTAARNWLWQQPARTFINGHSGGLDAWVKTLRESFGLEIHIDARAPLVAALPLSSDGATLRDYLSNQLAACEIAATGIETGERVVLHRIGVEPAAEAKPLDARAALDLPLYSPGQSGSVVQAVREALWLRGIQLVAPDADVQSSNVTLRSFVDALAHLLERGVRVESDLIELK